MTIQTILINQLRKTLSALIIGFLLTCSATSVHAQQLIRVELDQLEAQDKLLDAYLLLQKNKRNEAINLLKNLQSNYPSEAVFCYELSKIYWEDGDEENALAYLDKMLQKDNSNPWYLSYAAFVYESAGKIDKALTANIGMSKVDSMDFSHVARVAKNYADLDQLDKGIQFINNYEKKHGESRAAVIEKHHLYHYKRSFDEAEQVVKDWIQKHPKDIEALEVLADFQIKLNKPEAASDTYKTLIEVVPDHRDAQLFLLGKGASGSNEDSEDSSWYERTDVDLNLKVGRILGDLEKINDPVSEEFDRIIENAAILTHIHPNDAKSHSLLADLFFLKEDYASSLKHYENALAKDQTKFALWENALESAYSSGNDKKLYELAENALLYFPDRFLSFYYMAVAHSKKKEYDEALSLLDEARLMIGSNSENTIKYLGLQAMTSSFKQGKLTGTDKSWESNPRLAVISHYIQVRLNAENGKSSINSAKSSPFKSLADAWSYFHQKDLDGLVSLSQKILPNQGVYNEYLELLSKLYKEKGNNVEADKVVETLYKRGAFKI